MNKDKMLEIIKNIIGILLIIYGLRIGQQFFLPSGILDIQLNYIESDYPQIVTISKGSPVLETNISINDTIISVDNEDMKDKPLRYVAGKIMGKPNTEVILKVRNDKGIQEYPVKRIKRKINWFPF